MQDKVLYRGRPFDVHIGDVITLYQTPEPMEDEESAEVSIAGIVNRAPLYVDTETPTRMVVLVTEDFLYQLEATNIRQESQHHVSLRGVLEDPDEMEAEAERYGKLQNDVAVSVANYDESLKREYAAIEGFRTLLAALTGLLLFVCVCGNFAVSWNISGMRQGEYAELTAIGMKPGELRKMRFWEMLFNLIAAFVPGFLAGVTCHLFIYKIYSVEYYIDWHFPWDGLLLGISVLGMAALINEFALAVSARRLNGKASR